MPIKDRTRRRLVRLGTIRLGKQVPNASGNGTHPVQTDYFVLTDAPEIATVYGDEPRELDVLLPFPDIARNYDANYQVWAGGVLVCQGDGESVQYATPHTVKVDDKGNTHVYRADGDTLVSNGIAQVAFDWNSTHFEPGEIVTCPGADKDLYPHCASCKMSGLLKVMMADPRLFRMGYYQISTGSKRNHDTIMGTLEFMPSDRVNAIPFKLRLVEEKVTYNDGGKRKQGTKWFLQLEPDPTITRKLYQRQTDRMLGEPTPRAALPESTGPEWEQFEEVDAPEPPPYAVDGVLEETDTEPEWSAPSPPFDPVPIPDGMKNEEHVIKQAIKLMPEHYPDAGKVCTTLYQYGGNEWKKLPVTELWQALNDAVASREAS